jgi:hypothetical protein
VVDENSYLFGEQVYILLSLTAKSPVASRR